MTKQNQQWVKCFESKITGTEMFFDGVKCSIRINLTDKPEYFLQIH